MAKFAARLRRLMRYAWNVHAPPVPMPSVPSPDVGPVPMPSRQSDNDPVPMPQRCYCGQSYPSVWDPDGIWHTATVCRYAGHVTTSTYAYRPL